MNASPESTRNAGDYGEHLVKYLGRRETVSVLFSGEPDMEENIFDGIKNKIKNIFHKEEETTNVEMIRIEPDEELSDPLESRMTEEYVAFLEETEGGSPMPEEPETRQMPLEEESGDVSEQDPAEEPEQGPLPEEAFWPDDDPWEEEGSRTSPNE